MGGDGKVEAKDAAFVGRGIRGLEDVCSGDGGVGTKDDEDATSVAGAGNVEEPGPGPESARAWNSSIKVRRVIDDPSLCHNSTIKVVLAKPGDQLRDLVAGEATSVEVDET
jgi:hypothetical protein